MTDATLTRVVNIIREIEPGDDVYGQLVKDVTDAADALNHNNTAAFAKATYNLNDKTNRMAAAFNIGNVNENVDLGGYAVQLGQANVSDIIKTAFQPETGGLEAVSQRWTKVDLNAQKMRAKAASGQPQAVEQKNIFDQMMEDDQVVEGVTQIAGDGNGNANPVNRPTRANTAPSVMAARPDEPPPRDPHYNEPNDPDPVPVRGGPPNPNGGGAGGGGAGGGGAGGGGGAAAAAAAGGGGGGFTAPIGDAAVLGMITGVGGQIAKNMEIDIRNPYVYSGTDLAKQTGGRLWNSMMGGLDLTGDIMSGNISNLPSRVEDMVKESPAGWAIGRLFGWNTEKKMGENMSTGSTVGGSIGISSSTGPTGDILSGGNKPPELPYSKNGFLSFDVGSTVFNSSANNLDEGVEVVNQAQGGYGALGESGFMRDETVSQNLQAFSYMDPLYEINALINMKRGGGAGTIIGQASAASGQSTSPFPGTTGSAEFYTNALRYMSDFFSLRANSMFSQPMRLGFARATMLSAAVLVDPNIVGHTLENLHAIGSNLGRGAYNLGLDALIVGQHLDRYVVRDLVNNYTGHIPARIRNGIDDFDARRRRYFTNREARRINRQYQDYLQQVMEARGADIDIDFVSAQDERMAEELMRRHEQPALDDVANRPGVFASIRNRIIGRPRHIERRMDIQPFDEGLARKDLPVPTPPPPPQRARTGVLVHTNPQEATPAAPHRPNNDLDNIIIGPPMSDASTMTEPSATVTRGTSTQPPVPTANAQTMTESTAMANTATMTEPPAMTNAQTMTELPATASVAIGQTPQVNVPTTESVGVGQTPPSNVSTTTSVGVGQTPEEGALRTLAEVSSSLANVAEASTEVSNTTSGAPPTNLADLSEANVINPSTPGMTTRTGNRIPPRGQQNRSMQTPDLSATPKSTPKSRRNLSGAPLRSARTLDFASPLRTGKSKLDTPPPGRKVGARPMSRSERKQYLKRMAGVKPKVNSSRTTTNTNPPKKKNP